MSSKTCYKCKNTKTIDNYHKDRTRVDGYFPACKSCRSSYSKEYRKKYPEIEFNRWLRQYGIDYQDYLALKESQNNQCKICEVSFETISNKSIHVDHCHTTGIVRGILCQHCNHMLGSARDNINILREGIVYLESVEEVYHQQ